ncbi:hypothetical protein PAXRUDRAFT_827940 [Paxillus rubicundulus Ve08.2h10]|uniref:Uncharacterized protein n=1 Tax=Paxillus rubicundulus Ve08.2h10 TaxID=930991 RepID=A0A0D0DWZ9_9AGAM|nr:hypothetical protein PAXRUDRAFT_827940 [Paxillus rubicundulus Ve08.2h10]
MDPKNRLSRQHSPKPAVPAKHAKGGEQLITLGGCTALLYYQAFTKFEPFDRDLAQVGDAQLLCARMEHGNRKAKVLSMSSRCSCTSVMGGPGGGFWCDVMYVLASISVGRE